MSGPRTLRDIWYDFGYHGVLSRKWKQFEVFCHGIPPKPAGRCRLVRVSRTRKAGPGNVRWQPIRFSIRRTGGIAHPLYSTWTGMLNRCYAKGADSYPLYGGRGITVCPEWHDFQGFLRDMSPRPSPDHSLDRRKNDVGYSKDNCRWATSKEQANNRSNNHHITHQGMTLTLAQWADRSGVQRATFRSRVVRKGIAAAIAWGPTRPKRKIIILTVGGVTRTCGQWARSFDVTTASFRVWVYRYGAEEAVARARKKGKT